MKKRKLSFLTALSFLLLIMNAPLLRAQTSANATPQAGATPATPAPQRDERVWREALKIQHKSIVVDTHNDITTMMIDDNYDLGTSSVGKYHTDLARMKEGGLTAEFFSVYVDRSYATKGGSARRALDQIDLVYRAAERYPEKMMMATSVADIRRAKKQGKIAALMGIEGGHAIENSLMALRDFYRLGVRYMTLTHNNTNDWADACCDTARHNGLSDYGRDVIREMNRLGMFVDVSHVSDKTMSDVLDVSTAPIIASHSSARALSNHPRNVPDDLLRRIAKNGGVVMVNFYPVFIDQKVLDANKERNERLKPQLDALAERYKDDPVVLAAERQKVFDANPLPATPLSVLIDHIDHIARVAGVDHVGIGSDFDGVPSLPVGIEDISKLPVITYELLRRGYHEKDIRKILGENLLRAFAEVERVASKASRNISGEGNQRRLSTPPK
jgi:membrane dipeptidase